PVVDRATLRTATVRTAGRPTRRESTARSGPDRICSATGDVSRIRCRVALGSAGLIGGWPDDWRDALLPRSAPDRCPATDGTSGSDQAQGDSSTSEALVSRLLDR